MADSDVLALLGVGEKSAAPLVRARLAELAPAGRDGVR